jgi:uncharacterized protein
VITAFLLGFMGSLHCAGMCGPLILMIPVVGSSRASHVMSRGFYHAGRISVYGAVGLLFGLIGESIALAGFQRWLSIITGTLMLAALLSVIPIKAKLWRMPLFLKKRFASSLQRRTFSSIFALGAINGLLPCGLVYMAATASVAAGGAIESILYMILFGAGTLPMLIGISFIGNRSGFLRVPTLQKLVPIAVAAVAIALILRGDPISLWAGGSKNQCPVCIR